MYKKHDYMELLFSCAQWYEGIILSCSAHYKNVIILKKLLSEIIKCTIKHLQNGVSCNKQSFVYQKKNKLSFSLQLNFIQQAEQKQ